MDKEILLMCVGKETSPPRCAPAKPKELEPPTLALAGMTKTKSEFVLRQREFIIVKPSHHIHLFILGRVHSAMVSKINPQQRSVTVEWYERGETKGKEVELDMLLELNPELIKTRQTFIEPPPPSNLPINLQRVSFVRRELFDTDPILPYSSLTTFP